MEVRTVSEPSVTASVDVSLRPVVVMFPLVWMLGGDPLPLPPPEEGVHGDKGGQRAVAPTRPGTSWRRSSSTDSRHKRVDRLLPKVMFAEPAPYRVASPLRLTGPLKSLIARGVHVAVDRGRA